MHGSMARADMDAWKHGTAQGQRLSFGGVQGANPPLVAAPAPQAPPIPVLIPSPPSSPGVLPARLPSQKEENTPFETPWCTLGLILKCLQPSGYLNAASDPGLELVALHME